MRLAFVVAALVCGAASAQVYKCPDPANNRTVYSDKPCVGAGVQLEQKRSQAEMEYDRQRAAAAYQRFQDEQRREAAREQGQQRAAYSQPRQASTTGQSGLKLAGGTHDCRTARREAELAGSIKTGTEDSRRNAFEAAQMKAAGACGQSYTPQRQPTFREQVLLGELADPIHPCKVGGSCLGSVSEMRYTRVSENTFTREDGKSCSGSDTAVICP